MFENDQNTVAIGSIRNENGKSILALIKEGNKKFNSDGYRDVVFVLGNSGAGKSTLSQLIAGDNDNLISIPVDTDSSEFIISDNNNKISVDTAISKTVFPEIIIDKDKTAFIDCPGFNDDGRRAFYDIVSAYFINKAFNSVENVKIVLVVSHPSLRKGVNRSDFTQLLKHITNLIKNNEKYADSIALVATKVDNVFNSEKIPPLIPDSSIIRNIANFLQEIKKSLKTMQQDDPKNVYFEHATNLLNSLLQKNGTEYTRLGIFRRPNKPGKLSNIPLLQDGKKVLHNLIQNLKYSPIDKANIGYTVSDKSKNVIRDLVQEIRKNMADCMMIINNELIQHYKELEERMYNEDLYTLIDHLKTASSALSRISGIDERSSVVEMINILCENLIIMNARVSRSALRGVMNLNEFSIFIQKIGEEKSEFFGGKLAKELNAAVQHVDNSLKWYSFLASSYPRLSEYDIQQNIENYISPVLPTGIENFQVSNSSDFVNLLNEMGDKNFLKTVNYQELKKVYLDETKIRYFDLLINATLKDSVTFTCTVDGERLQVVGEYVKLSKVIRNTCYLRSKSVQILAKHTIFIDSDLIKDNDISIIAPHWNIIGSRKIISLNGFDGGSHTNEKANDGICDGCNGEDGLPGNPGTSGGHFFGLGNSFTNSENLVIMADGGDGGFGQHGGDGMRGAPGKTENLRPKGLLTTHILLNCYKDKECETEIRSRRQLFGSNEVFIKHKIHGTVGGRGGNSGHGGVGGVGGNGGSVTLIGSNSVSISTKNGSDGSFGLHGQCGSGGDGGAHKYQFYDKNFCDEWIDKEDRNGEEGEASKGDPGICLYSSNYTNSNSKGIKQPEQKKFLHPPPLTLSDFKKNFVNNLYDIFKKPTSQEYYLKLQTNPELDKFYNATIVLREIQQIEKHYNQFSFDTNVLLYQSLLTKTTELGKTAKTNNQVEQSKLLEILNAVLTSKLIRLKSRPETSFPLHRDEYFNKLSLANSDEIRRYYSDITDTRISKTIEFIKKFIVDDVNDSIEHMDAKIVELAFAGDHSKLDDVLFQRKLLKSLQSLGEFLILAGSLGRADLVIMDQTKINQIFTSSHFESVEIPTKSPIINEMIKLLNRIENKINHYIDEIVWTISKQRKSLQALGDGFNEACDQLRNIEKYLQSQSRTDETYFSISNSIKDMLNRFENTNNDLLKKNTNNKVSDLVQRSRNYMKLIQFDSETFREIKSEPNNILSITISAIDRIFKKTAELDKSHDELLNIRNPIITTVYKNLLPSGYKPLDIWKIRQIVHTDLKTLKSWVHRLLSTLELDEDMQMLSENIDEAINAMLNAYENLISQEDRTRLKALYQYGKDRLNSESNDVQNILTASFQGDIMLYEYERLIDVFKRYVFPFETLNPSSLSLPSMLSYDQNLESLRSAITRNVHYIQSKLKDLQNSKEYIVEDYFNNTSTSGSFFVWKNHIYGNAISKLLRGKQVALKATMEENDNREMLKFDSINLGFHSANETIQQLLDETMKNFNVFLTHSGNSYFEFCNRVHLFNSDSITLTYNSSETMAQFQPVLSPFTVWTIQLEPISPNVTFKNLEPFRQHIDIHLEGHAKYINLQNKSICEKFETDGIVNYYRSFVTQNTDKVVSSKSTRRRRDVSSQETNFSDTSRGKENFSFWKLLNPLSFFIGSNSQNDIPSSTKSLEWNTESSHSTNTIHSSFNLNPTLSFLNYLVRTVTKAKPYQTKTASNLDQMRQADVLEIVDRFEALLLKLSDDLHITPSQLEFEPVQLMSQLEKEIVKGDLLAIKKVLRNSVHLNTKFRDILDTELVQMLDKMDENSQQHPPGFDNKNEEQFYNDYVEHAFKDYTDGMITSKNENFNASLLNWYWEFPAKLVEKIFHRHEDHRVKVFDEINSHNFTKNFNLKDQ